jgi:hypothetical protein
MLGSGLALDQFVIEQSLLLVVICETPTLSTLKFLLMFFVSQLEISLLNEVNRISDMVDNQSNCAKIVGFGSFDLESDRYVAFHQNKSYLEPHERSGTSSPSVSLLHEGNMSTCQR